MKTFDLAVRAVLKHEGGYVNDSHDPGGETKYGICKRSYPKLDIATLEIDDAIAIYRRDFWDRIHGDELPADLACFLLDTAVNLGVVQAVRYLQRAANVQVDGIMGPATILACKRDGVLDSFAGYREEHYRKLRTFDRFGRGWLRRMYESLAAARTFTNQRHEVIA